MIKTLLTDEAGDQRRAAVDASLVEDRGNVELHRPHSDPERLRDDAVGHATSDQARPPEPGIGDTSQSLEGSLAVSVADGSRRSVSGALPIKTRAAAFEQ